MTNPCNRKLPDHMAICGGNAVPKPKALLSALMNDVADVEKGCRTEVNGKIVWDYLEYGAIPKDKHEQDQIVLWCCDNDQPLLLVSFLQECKIERLNLAGKKPSLQNEDLDSSWDDNFIRCLKSILKMDMMVQLIHLDLSSNELGNVGAELLAEGLAESRSLTSLDLSYNRITQSGLQKLMNAVRGNHVCAFADLNLNGNRVGDHGANYIAQMLEENSSIFVVRLKDTSICTQGVKRLADVLKARRAALKFELDLDLIAATGIKSLEEAREKNFITAAHTHFFERLPLPPEVLHEYVAPYINDLSTAHTLRLLAKWPTDETKQ